MYRAGVSHYHSSMMQYVAVTCIGLAFLGGNSLCKGVFIWLTDIAIIICGSRLRSPEVLLDAWSWSQLREDDVLHVLACTAMPTGASIAPNMF